MRCAYPLLARPVDVRCGAKYLGVSCHLSPRDASTANDSSQLPVARPWASRQWDRWRDVSRSDTESYLIRVMHVQEDRPALDDTMLFSNVSVGAAEPLIGVRPCGSKVLLPKQQHEHCGRVVVGEMAVELRINTLHHPSFILDHLDSQIKILDGPHHMDYGRRVLVSCAHESSVS